MRIAQIAPRGVHPYSGLLASLVHVSAALAQQGIQVEVWQLHPWTDENAQMTALLEAAGIELVAIDVGDSQWRLSSRASHQIAQRRVDIAHLHGVFNPTNTAVARELEVPYAISPHGGYAAESLSYHRWRKSAFKFALELPMLRRAAAVSALTEQESNEVRDFGFEGRVLVIPNGVRPIATDLDADAFRGELGLDRSTALAMYAGRIDTRGKRLGDVVRAVAGNARWHLALMGGDFRGGIDEAARLANELQAADRIHFPAPRRDKTLHEALADADVFMLLSKSEGMPIALLEALAVGTPAVVSPEVERLIGVSASGAGWVTEPEGLTSVLRQLDSLSPQEWGQRRKAAKALASQYDWSDVATAYEDLYRQILA